MSSPVVNYAVSEGVAVVTLNRPASLNAVNLEMREALTSLVDDVEEDPAIRVAILTGTGERAFCAGADLKEMSAGRVNRLRSSGGFAGFVRRVRTTPFIAAVNGLALGGGLELALACEMVVAADHASFALPEALRGIIAGGGGAIRLPARLPRAIALEMLLTGSSMSAARAADWGLVNRVVPPGELIGASMELALAICRAAPIAVAASMAVARASEAQLEGAAWELSDAAVERVRLSDDAREGPTAFAAKRSPIWTGN